MGDFSPPQQLSILALGSAHGDDRVAWEAATRMADDPKLAGMVYCLASPWDIVDYLAAGQCTIVIDACQGAGRAGAVRCLTVTDGEFDDAAWGRHSTHGGSLGDALQLGQNLHGDIGQIAVVLAEIEQAHPGTEMSECARRAVDEIVKTVAMLLSQWRVR